MAKSSKRNTNAPRYLLSATIDDSLGSSRLAGKAGAGQIVGLYNQTDNYWMPRVVKGKRVEPLANYFRADTKEIKDEATGKADPNFPTRKMMQDKWLSEYSVNYKKQLAHSVVLQAKLANAKDKENPGLILKAQFALKAVDAPLNAARSMFHRSMTALAHLYNVLPVKVILDANNAIDVVMSNPEDEIQGESHGQFNASDLVSLGDKVTKKKEWVATKATPPNASVTTIVPPAVNATTAKTVMGELEKLFTSDKFNPPVSVAGSKRAETTVDKYDQAEFALICIGDIKRADINKSADLRETISKLAVAVMTLLQVSTVEQATKLQGSLRETTKSVA